MKAAVLYGKEDVRIEAVPEAALKPGEVRVEIRAALTCGTDLKVFRRGYHAKMIVPPAVFGHELSGVISEIGQGITAWKVGDRVVVANSAPCEACRWCKGGQANLCEDLLFLNGAYAESIVVPERIVRKNLLRLRDETAFKDAALVEPLACVVLGIEDLRPQPGETALIIGAGPIGLMFCAVLKQQGCGVTVAGRHPERLEAARRLGADRVIDVEDGRSPAQAMETTGQGFPDLVVEATGKPEVWESATQVVRKGGRVNFFGGCPSGTTVTLDTGLIHYSNLTLLASFHHTPRTIRRALELIEDGIVRGADFVSGECGLEDLPNLLRTMARGNRAVKTLVRV